MLMHEKTCDPYILRLLLASVAVLTGLYLTWSHKLKAGFLMMWLKYTCTAARYSKAHVMRFISAKIPIGLHTKSTNCSGVV